MNVLHEVFWEGAPGGAWQELVCAALAGAGVEQTAIVEEERRGVCRVSVFCPLRSEAGRLMGHFRLLRLKGVRLRQCVHRRTDWETRWKEGWKPFPLTARIHVIPLFLKGAVCPRGKVPFYLDTTAAFGTGLHETTRFSSRLIEGLQGKFNSMLDVGTGTGILAAVALLSGAVHVEAFDIDPAAVQVARRNLKVNGLRCHGLRACDLKEYHPSGKFDLVAANLVTHDLVACQRKLIMCVRPGGYLIISGISLENMPLVRSKYGRCAALRTVKVVQGKEWSAFLFRKKV